eukprot:357832-Chlamydomonas_euryale.AAC.2
MTFEARAQHVQGHAVYRAQERGRQARRGRLDTGGILCGGVKCRTRQEVHASSDHRPADRPVNTSLGNT